MSLHPEESPSVPEDTRRVALAAFPNGTPCLHITDALGPIYRDGQIEQFPLSQRSTVRATPEPRIYAL
jgi:hypothetical protein